MSLIQVLCRIKFEKCWTGFKYMENLLVVKAFAIKIKEMILGRAKSDVNREYVPLSALVGIVVVSFLFGLVQVFKSG